MKTILFILSFSLILSINAQTIKVEYEESIDPSSFAGRKSIYKYILSDMKSLYYNDFNDINIFPNIDWEPEIIKEDKNVKTVKFDEDHTAQIMQNYYFKDYRSHDVTYNSLQGFKDKCVVRESLNLFDWQIQDDADTVIMGFHCQKARTDFRGRKYTAYFTSEISTYGGPWKFDGLPGLILLVKDDDDFFIINAVKLDVVENTTSIANPFAKEKNIITWDEYTKAYYENMKKILKYSKSISSPGEETKIIMKNGIEYLGFYELSTDDL